MRHRKFASALICLALLASPAMAQTQHAPLYWDATVARDTWTCETHHSISLVVMAEQTGKERQTNWRDYGCLPLARGEHITVVTDGSGASLGISRYGTGYVLPDDLNIDMRSGKLYRPVR